MISEEDEFKKGFDPQEGDADEFQCKTWTFLTSPNFTRAVDERMLLKDNVSVESDEISDSYKNLIELEEDADEFQCKTWTFPTSPNFTRAVDERMLLKDNVSVESNDISDSYSFPTRAVDERMLLEDDVSVKSDEIFDSYANLIELPVDFKKLMFRELFDVGKNANIWKESSNLLTMSDITVDLVGAGSITIKKIEEDQILILFIQRVTIEKVQAIMEVITVLDENLHLIRENIIERVISADSSVEEKSLQIIPEDGKEFKTKKQIIENGVVVEEKDSSITLENEKLSNFASFGTNIILMRYLVLQNFIGCIRTWTIDINGEFHTINDYYRAPTTVNLNGYEVKVQQIERFFVTECGKAWKSKSIFNSSTGHLLQDFSEKSSYVTRRLSSDLSPSGQWEDDVQLLLLDFVSSRKTMKNVQNSRVKNLLRDFTACVINSKPKDLMDFTLNFLKKVERDAIVLKRNQITSTRRHQQNSGE